MSRHEHLDPRIDPAWVADLKSDPRDWNSLEQQKEFLDAMEATGFVTFPKPQPIRRWLSIRRWWS